MNPFSLRLLWKAIRGRSLTFALLFATVLLGYSGFGLMKSLFLAIPVLPVWMAYVLPFVVIGLLARFEPRLLPDPRRRAILSFGVVGLSIALTYSVWRWEQAVTPEPPPATEAPEPADTPERDRKPGPPGKR
jgi:polyferredoxin